MSASLACSRGVLVLATHLQSLARLGAGSGVSHRRGISWVCLLPWRPSLHISATFHCFPLLSASGSAPPFKSPTLAPEYHP